jgi:hypothetical protein
MSNLHFQIYHPTYMDGNMGDKFALKFLNINSYRNNRHARDFSIIFPSIFILLLWVYMHDTR